MLINQTQGRAWADTDFDGIQRCLFRNNELGGRSSLVRLRAGTAFPKHGHEGHEEVLILEGCVEIAGVKLETGDYLYTEPGEVHGVIAICDSIIFVSSQKPTPFLVED